MKVILNVPRCLRVTVAVMKHYSQKTGGKGLLGLHFHSTVPHGKESGQDPKLYVTRELLSSYHETHQDPAHLQNPR